MPDNASIVERLVLQIGAKVDRTSIGSALSVYTQVSTALAAATAAGVAWTISQAAQIDEVAKTARALQLTTEEYTAYTFAAERSGLTSQEMGQSLRYLQTQLEAVSRDTGEALPWFQRLGIAATDSEGHIRSAADVLPQLADEYTELTTKGDRASFAIRVFGESGQKMTTLLEGGSAGIAELTAEAERLGVVLGSDAAANAETLTDSMTSLRASAAGLAYIVSDALVPAVTPLVDGLTDWLAADDGLARTAAAKVADSTAWALRQLDTDAGKAVAGITAVGAAIGTLQGARGMVGALGMANPMLGAMSGSMLTGGASAAKFAAPVVLAALVLEDFAVAARGGDSAIVGLAEAFGYGEETAALFVEGANAARGALGVLSVAGTAVGSVMRDGVAAGIDAVADSLRRVSPELSGVAEALDRIGATMEIPGLQTLFGMLGRDTLSRLLPGGEVTLRTAEAAAVALPSAFSTIGRGGSDLARFASGDPSVQRVGDGGLLGPALSPLLTAADRQRSLALQERAALGQIPGPATGPDLFREPANVTVQQTFSVQASSEIRRVINQSANDAANAVRDYVEGR
jgi:hypothetical protein